MAILKKIIPALLFGVVYAILILVGWGIDDISGFFSHPARTVLFAVTITVNSLVMFFKDRLGAGFDEKGEKVDPKEKRMLNEEFGVEWENFCGRTAKKLIPFVY